MSLSIQAVEKGRKLSPVVQFCSKGTGFISEMKQFMKVESVFRQSHWEDLFLWSQ
jgi:hypothetical protein